MKTSWTAFYESRKGKRVATRAVEASSKGIAINLAEAVRPKGFALRRVGVSA